MCFETKNTCPLCNGKGRIPRPALGGGWEGEPCPKCHPAKPEPAWLVPTLKAVLYAIILAIVAVLCWGVSR